jgi:hypothetical protein
VVVVDAPGTRGGYRRIMTQEQPYVVVHTLTRGGQLRRYPAHVVAEVTTKGSFSSAGNIAFGPLFAYINGENRPRRTVAMTAPVVQSSSPRERIAMTAPVVQHGGDDSYTVAFVLPASMTEETAPEPANPRVQIRTVPSRLAAALTYSGRWSQASYEHHCARLLQALESEGLTPVGGPRFARFDPPFKPWFLRRNEVVIDVEEPAGPEGGGT